MRRSQRRAVVVAVSWILTASAVPAQDLDWSGYVSVEPRMFWNAPAFPQQTNHSFSFSAVLAPELRYAWNDGDDRFTVIPFLRGDADDGGRSHADFREFNWLHLAGPWAFRIGLGKVFWGVTEARHLVDIVNQTDLVEDVDQEDKLGQAMIQIERYTPSGTFSLFLLPGFRERTFPADDGRLRGPLPIDAGRAGYESGAGDDRSDVAVRWANAFGAWDIGISGFHGTSREPRFEPSPIDSNRLLPYYDVITQLGVDLQFTRKAWLWKLEATRRSGHGSRFDALVAGFEYTLFGIGRGGADLGLLAEWLYDGRDANAPPVAYDDDIFFGLRFAANDVDDTMFLFGLITDRRVGGTAGFVEAERRVGDRWRFEAELRWFEDTKDDALAGIRKDSVLTVRLARFF